MFCTQGFCHKNATALAIALTGTVALSTARSKPSPGLVLLALQSWTLTFGEMVGVMVEQSRTESCRQIIVFDFLKGTSKVPTHQLRLFWHK